MSPDNLIITIAQAKDAEALTEPGITTFRDAFGPHNRKEDMDKYIANEMNLEKITAEINDNNNVFFLAVYKHEMIGYAKMRTSDKPKELEDKNPIEIERIYVSQLYHDKKIGAALMEQCVAHALGNRHDTLWLGVWENNHRAVRFYKRWGFELFGSHPFLLGDDLQTDVLMKKEL